MTGPRLHPGAPRDPATAAAELALRRLGDAYAVAVDERDAEAFCELFTPTGELSVHAPPGGPAVRRYAGRDELARIVEVVSRYRMTAHRPITTQVRVEGDRATGVSLCTAHHVAPDPGGGHRDLVMDIRYRDRYARGEDGTWRIAQREVHRLWTTTRAVEVADG